MLLPIQFDTKADRNTAAASGGARETAQELYRETFTDLKEVIQDGIRPAGPGQRI